MIERCLQEIAAIEAQIQAGHPDLPGLCLALADWSAERRLIEEEMRQRAEKPATGSAGRAGEGTRRLAADGVHPLSVVALGRFQLQSHLLRDRPAEEAANRMRLPAGGFPQFGERRTLGSLQQGDYLGLLAALAGGRGLFSGFRRLLARSGLSGPTWPSTPQRGASSPHRGPS